MPKSSKQFVLSSESVNSHGFWIVTSGIDLTGFRKNPIMYWMHAYPDEVKPAENMPIGYWDDIKVQGTELIATPVFDDNDELAMRIYNKVEHGTIRSASVAISPVKLDANRANWKPGQTSPTYNQSVIDEASIVDRGSNKDAVALSLDSKAIFLSKATRSAGENKPHPDSQTFEDPGVKELRDVLTNSVAAGKISSAEAESYLKMGSDDKKTKGTIYEIIRTTPINKTGTLTDSVRPFLLKSALKSYDEIKRTESGSFHNLVNYAPELAKAKYFEKHGKMPPIMRNWS